MPRRAPLVDLAEPDGGEHQREIAASLRNGDRPPQQDRESAARQQHHRRVELQGRRGQVDDCGEPGLRVSLLHTLNRSLQQMGGRVGILDCDIFGPSLPILLHHEHDQSEITET